MWAPLPTLFVNNFTPCIPFSQYFAGKIYILIKLKLHFCATFRPYFFLSVRDAKQPIFINFFGFFLSMILFIRMCVFKVSRTCLKHIYVMVCENIINLYLIILQTYGQSYSCLVMPLMYSKTQKRRGFCRAAVLSLQFDKLFRCPGQVLRAYIRDVQQVFYPDPELVLDIDAGFQRHNMSCGKDIR